jgi:hypothetical protein
MDNEFEKLQDYSPMLALNIPAANDHVGNVERRIRVIKEQSRGILCTMRYPRLPQNMLIHLLPQCGSTTFPRMTEYRLNTALENSSSAIASPLNCIAVHLLGFIVRLTKIIHPQI